MTRVNPQIAGHANRAPRTFSDNGEEEWIILLRVFAQPFAVVLEGREWPVRQIGPVSACSVELVAIEQRLPMHLGIQRLQVAEPAFHSIASRHRRTDPVRDGNTHSLPK